MSPTLMSPLNSPAGLHPPRRSDEVSFPKGLNTEVDVPTKSRPILIIQNVEICRDAAPGVSSTVGARIIANTVLRCSRSITYYSCVNSEYGTIILIVRRPLLGPTVRWTLWLRLSRTARLCLEPGTPARILASSAGKEAWASLHMTSRTKQTTKLNTRDHLSAILYGYPGSFG